MTTQPFLYVDGEPISNSQVLEYLQAAEQANGFVASILRQHIISKALTSYDILPSIDIVKECLVRFCEKFNLKNQTDLDEFLAKQSLPFTVLQRRLASNWAMQQLIQCISEPFLQDEFISRRGQLDRVIVSCIALDDQGLANELFDKLTEEEDSFEELAKAYSLAESRKDGGRLEPIYRGNLPAVLQLALGNTQPGDLIGPLEIDGHWLIYRLEEVIPASLEGDLEADLRTTLFEEQLTKEMSQMEVKMQVTQWQYLQTSTH